MEWIFEPNKRIEINFMPWGKKLTLSSIYKGKSKRVEKIWGRRRWLIIEKIIPIANSFTLRLYGFGMPQFIIADLGTMKMTIGFTSWSANDWVKGTTFNIMAGLIGEGTEQVFNLLKKHRKLSLQELKSKLPKLSEDKIKSGVGLILRRSQGYIDPINNMIRFRQLFNVPLPEELYKTNYLEERVNSMLMRSLDITLVFTNDKEYHATLAPNTQIEIDQDMKIIKVNCKCREFQNGPRNISAPCPHILTLYVKISKYINSSLKINKKYTLNDLESLKV